MVKGQKSSNSKGASVPKPKQPPNRTVMVVDGRTGRYVMKKMEDK